MNHNALPDVSRRFNEMRLRNDAVPILIGPKGYKFWYDSYVMVVWNQASTNQQFMHIRPFCGTLNDAFKE